MNNSKMMMNKNNKLIKYVVYVVGGAVFGGIFAVLGLGLGLILGPLASIFVFPMILVGQITAEPFGNWTDLMRILVNGIGWSIVFGLFYYIKTTKNKK